MARHWLLMTMMFCCLPFFFKASGNAQQTTDAPAVVVLQKIQGHVVLLRNGKDITAETGLKDGFQLKDKDQIRLAENGRAVMAAKSFSLQLVPHSLVAFDFAPQGNRPGMLTLIYGHLRAVVRPKSPATKLDLLRVRLPGFYVGVKSAPSTGADFLVHSARNKGDFLKQIEGQETPAPRVRVLSDMNIFEDHYTRVDSLRGVLSVRADESTTSISVPAGAFFETSKKSEVQGDVASKAQSPENLIKIRKIFGI